MKKLVIFGILLLAVVIVLGCIGNENQRICNGINENSTIILKNQHETTIRVLEVFEVLEKGNIKDFNEENIAVLENALTKRDIYLNQLNFIKNQSNHYGCAIPFYEDENFKDVIEKHNTFYDSLEDVTREAKMQSDLAILYSYLPIS